MAAPAPVLNTTLALKQQTRQATAVAQAKARATVKRRHRSDSVISQEGGAPKYRTRSMIIVYYDSYVQSFFEELVRFVSASRNLMRKAKIGFPPINRIVTGFWVASLAMAYAAVIQYYIYKSGPCYDHPLCDASMVDGVAQGNVSTFLVPVFFSH